MKTVLSLLVLLVSINILPPIIIVIFTFILSLLCLRFTYKSFALYMFLLTIIGLIVNIDVYGDYLKYFVFGILFLQNIGERLELLKMARYYVNVFPILIVISLMSNHEEIPWYIDIDFLLLCLILIDSMVLSVITFSLLSLVDVQLSFALILIIYHLGVQRFTILSFLFLLIWFEDIQRFVLSSDSLMHRVYTMGIIWDSYDWNSVFFGLKDSLLQLEPKIYYSDIGGWAGQFARFGFFGILLPVFFFWRYRSRRKVRSIFLASFLTGGALFNPLMFLYFDLVDSRKL